jgi:hypothetical protein
VALCHVVAAHLGPAVLCHVVHCGARARACACASYVGGCVHGAAAGARCSNRTICQVGAGRVWSLARPQQLTHHTRARTCTQAPGCARHPPLTVPPLAQSLKVAW